ncbi:MAG: NAD(P)-binding oxidoreductase [Gemmatimonadaceae bacterium]|jgi:nucleoside-diphosphate-sugar epimerase
MSTQPTVLLVGATGRTGRRVLTQLLDAGAKVRVIVRSAARLPVVAVDHANLTVLEADLLSLGDDDLQRQVRGCDAVISCLGHVISLKGVFGPPRDLVARATARLCRAIQSLRPAAPVRFILMSSVSVFRPGAADARRGAHEKAFLWTLCRILPPASDNQCAADFLCQDVGTADSHVQWVAVRPDTLLDGEVTEYALHEGLVTGLFKPANTNMANVAHFMCALATDATLFDAWKGKLPVIINAAAQ